MKNHSNCRNTLVIGSLLSVCTTTLSATDIQAGVAAYNQGYYELAFNIFQQGAQEGDTTAQHLLGILYQTDKSVDSSPDAGFQRWLKAAKEGVLEAQLQVGLMYLQGEDVAENEEEAIKWLLKAANRGYPQASEILQFIYSDDFGAGC